MKSLKESLSNIDNIIDDHDITTYIELFKKCDDIEDAFDLIDMNNDEKYKDYKFAPIFTYLNQYNWIGTEWVEDEYREIGDWLGYLTRKSDIREIINFLNKICKLKGNRKLNYNNIEDIYVSYDMDDGVTNILYFVVYKNMKSLVKRFIKQLNEKYSL